MISNFNPFPLTPTISATANEIMKVATNDKNGKFPEKWVVDRETWNKLRNEAFNIIEFRDDNASMNGFRICGVPIILGR